MNVTEVAVFTHTITGTTFTIPSGARTIDLNNTGGASGSWTGNADKGGVSSSAVTLGALVGYSFPDLGKPYPEITIDASATTIEINVNY